MTREEHGDVWQDAAKKMKALASTEPDIKTANQMLVLAMAMTLVGNSYRTLFGK